MHLSVCECVLWLETPESEIAVLHSADCFACEPRTTDCIPFLSNGVWKTRKSDSFLHKAIIVSIGVEHI